MTAKQPPGTQAGTDERRAHGLALADALLEGSRGMSPLTNAAHARVKRRLVASTRRGAFHLVGWLRPVVIVSIGLVCGAAFGVALDRVVLRPNPATPTTPSEGGSNLGRARTRSGRLAPKPVQPEAGQANVNSQGVGAELPPSNEGARPATNAEVLSSPETPSPARSSNHPKKLALRAEPLDTLARPARAIEQEVSPVAPSGVAADWPAPAAPAVQPAAPMAPTQSLPVTSAAPARGNAPATTSAADRLSEERLLAAAVRALRAESNPRSALAALDEYRAHYPHGRLFVEAEILRVDALSTQKDTRAVVRVLDGLEFAQMPGGLARQLQRAELRAAAGRHREAEADFASVLLRAQHQDLDMLERALWGRAQSRAGHGDAQGARLDATDYLRRFPAGRFAAAAARMGATITP